MPVTSCFSHKYIEAVAKQRLTKRTLDLSLVRRMRKVSDVKSQQSGSIVRFVGKSVHPDAALSLCSKAHCLRFSSIEW